MKTKLLLIILPVLFFTATLQAQTKVIDFGAYQLSGYDNLVDETAINNTCYSPAGVAGSTGNYVQNTFTLGGADPYNITYIQGTGTNDRIYTTNTGLAAYNNSPVAATPELSDYDVSKYGYFSPNGTGNTGRRQWEVTIPNGETVTFILASPGATPTLSISDDDGGSWSTFTNAAFSTDNTYAFKISNTSGAEDTYRWYDGSGKVRLFRVYFADINDAVLGIDKTKSFPVSTNVQALDNRIYISNVKSSTEVNIYSITGALVKAIKTNENMDFSFNTGLYIATIKTIEGQKSIKLLIR